MGNTAQAQHRSAERHAENVEREEVERILLKEKTREDGNPVETYENIDASIKKSLLGDNDDILTSAEKISFPMVDSTDSGNTMEQRRLVQPHLEKYDARDFNSVKLLRYTRSVAEDLPGQDAGKPNVDSVTPSHGTRRNVAEWCQSPFMKKLINKPEIEQLEWWRERGHIGVPNENPVADPTNPNPTPTSIPNSDVFGLWSFDAYPGRRINIEEKKKVATPGKPKASTKEEGCDVWNRPKIAMSEDEMIAKFTPPVPVAKPATPPGKGDNPAAAKGGVTPATAEGKATSAAAVAEKPTAEEEVREPTAAAAFGKKASKEGSDFFALLKKGDLKGGIVALLAQQGYDTGLVDELQLDGEIVDMRKDIIDRINSSLSPENTDPHETLTKEDLLNLKTVKSGEIESEHIASLKTKLLDIVSKSLKQKGAELASRAFDKAREKASAEEKTGGIPEPVGPINSIPKHIINKLARVSPAAEIELLVGENPKESGSALQAFRKAQIDPTALRRNGIIDVPEWTCGTDLMHWKEQLHFQTPVHVETTIKERRDFENRNIRKEKAILKAILRGERGANEKREGEKAYGENAEDSKGKVTIPRTPFELNDTLQKKYGILARQGGFAPLQAGPDGSYPFKRRYEECRYPGIPTPCTVPVRELMITPVAKNAADEEEFTKKKLGDEGETSPKPPPLRFNNKDEAMAECDRREKEFQERHASQALNDKLEKQEEETLAEYGEKKPEEQVENLYKIKDSTKETDEEGSLEEIPDEAAKKRARDALENPGGCLAVFKEPKENFEQDKQRSNDKILEQRFGLQKTVKAEEIPDTYLLYQRQVTHKTPTFCKSVNVANMVCRDSAQVFEDKRPFIVRGKKVKLTTKRAGTIGTAGLAIKSMEQVDPCNSDNVLCYSGKERLGKIDYDAPLDNPAKTVNYCFATHPKGDISVLMLSRMRAEGVRKTGAGGGKPGSSSSPSGLSRADKIEALKQPREDPVLRQLNEETKTFIDGMLNKWRTPKDREDPVITAAGVPAVPKKPQLNDLQMRYGEDFDSDVYKTTEAILELKYGRENGVSPALVENEMAKEARESDKLLSNEERVRKVEAKAAFERYKRRQQSGNPFENYNRDPWRLMEDKYEVNEEQVDHLRRAVEELRENVKKEAQAEGGGTVGEEKTAGTLGVPGAENSAATGAAVAADPLARAPSPTDEIDLTLPIKPRPKSCSILPPVDSTAEEVVFRQIKCGKGTYILIPKKTEDIMEKLIDAVEGNKKPNDYASLETNDILIPKDYYPHHSLLNGKSDSMKKIESKHFSRDVVSEWSNDQNYYRIQKTSRQQCKRMITFGENITREIANNDDTGDMWRLNPMESGWLERPIRLMGQIGKKLEPGEETHPKRQDGAEGATENEYLTQEESVEPRTFWMKPEFFDAVSISAEKKEDDAKVAKAKEESVLGDIISGDTVPSKPLDKYEKILIKRLKGIPVVNLPEPVKWYSKAKGWNIESDTAKVRMLDRKISKKFSSANTETEAEATDALLMDLKPDLPPDQLERGQYNTLGMDSRDEYAFTSDNFEEMTPAEYQHLYLYVRYGEGGIPEDIVKANVLKDSFANSIGSFVSSGKNNLAMLGLLSSERLASARSELNTLKGGMNDFLERGMRKRRRERNEAAVVEATYDEFREFVGRKDRGENVEAPSQIIVGVNATGEDVDPPTPEEIEIEKLERQLEEAEINLSKAEVEVKRKELEKLRNEQKARAEAAANGEDPDKAITPTNEPQYEMRMNPATGRVEPMLVPGTGPTAAVAGGGVMPGMPGTPGIPGTHQYLQSQMQAMQGMTPEQMQVHIQGQAVAGMNQGVGQMNSGVAQMNAGLAQANQMSMMAQQTGMVSGQDAALLQQTMGFANQGAGVVTQGAGALSGMGPGMQSGMGGTAGGMPGIGGMGGGVGGIPGMSSVFGMGGTSGGIGGGTIPGIGGMPGVSGMGGVPGMGGLPMGGIGGLPMGGGMPGIGGMGGMSGGFPMGGIGGLPMGGMSGMPTAGMGGLVGGMGAFPPGMFDEISKGKLNSNHRKLKLKPSADIPKSSFGLIDSKSFFSIKKKARVGKSKRSRPGFSLLDSIKRKKRKSSFGLIDSIKKKASKATETTEHVTGVDLDGDAMDDRILKPDTRFNFDSLYEMFDRKDSRFSDPYILDAEHWKRKIFELLKNGTFAKHIVLEEPDATDTEGKGDKGGAAEGSGGVKKGNDVDADADPDDADAKEKEKPRPLTNQLMDEDVFENDEATHTTKKVHHHHSTGLREVNWLPGMFNGRSVSDNLTPVYLAAKFPPHTPSDPQQYGTDDLPTPEEHYDRDKILQQGDFVGIQQPEQPAIAGIKKKPKIGKWSNEYAADYLEDTDKFLSPTGVSLEPYDIRERMRKVQEEAMTAQERQQKSLTEKAKQWEKDYYAKLQKDLDNRAKKAQKGMAKAQQVGQMALQSPVGKIPGMPPGGVAGLPGMIPGAQGIPVGTIPGMPGGGMPGMPFGIPGMDGGIPNMAAIGGATPAQLMGGMFNEISKENDKIGGTTSKSGSNSSSFLYGMGSMVGPMAFGMEGGMSPAMMMGAGMPPGMAGMPMGGMPPFMASSGMMPPGMSGVPPMAGIPSGMVPAMTSSMGMTRGMLSPGMMATGATAGQPGLPGVVGAPSVSAAPGMVADMAAPGILIPPQPQQIEHIPSPKDTWKIRRTINDLPLLTNDEFILMEIDPNSKKEGEYSEPTVDLRSMEEKVADDAAREKADAEKAAKADADAKFKKSFNEDYKHINDQLQEKAPGIEIYADDMKRAKMRLTLDFEIPFMKAMGISLIPDKERDEFKLLGNNIIWSVTPGSWAAQHGVVPGDILESIDGKFVGKLKSEDISKILSTEYMQRKGTDPEHRLDGMNLKFRRVMPHYREKGYDIIQIEKDVPGSIEKIWGEHIEGEGEEGGKKDDKKKKHEKGAKADDEADDTNKSTSVEKFLQSILPYRMQKKERKMLGVVCPIPEMTVAEITEAIQRKELEIKHIEEDENKPEEHRKEKTKALKDEMKILEVKKRRLLSGEEQQFSGAVYSANGEAGKKTMPCARKEWDKLNKNICPNIENDVCILSWRKNPNGILPTNGTAAGTPAEAGNAGVDYSTSKVFEPLPSTPSVETTVEDLLNKLTYSSSLGSSTIKPASKVIPGMGWTFGRDNIRSYMQYQRDSLVLLRSMLQYVDKAHKTNITMSRKLPSEITNETPTSKYLNGLVDPNQRTPNPFADGTRTRFKLQDLLLDQKTDKVKFRKRGIAMRDMGLSKFHVKLTENKNMKSVGKIQRIIEEVIENRKKAKDIEGEILSNDFGASAYEDESPPLDTINNGKWRVSTQLLSYDRSKMMNSFIDGPNNAAAGAGPETYNDGIVTSQEDLKMLGHSYLRLACNLPHELGSAIAGRYEYGVPKLSRFDDEYAFAEKSKLLYPDILFDPYSLNPDTERKGIQVVQLPNGNAGAGGAPNPTTPPENLSSSTTPFFLCPSMTKLPHRASDVDTGMGEVERRVTAGRIASKGISAGLGSTSSLLGGAASLLGLSETENDIDLGQPLDGYPVDQVLTPTITGDEGETSDARPALRDKDCMYEYGLDFYQETGEDLCAGENLSEQEKIKSLTAKGLTEEDTLDSECERENPEHYAKLKLHYLESKNAYLIQERDKDLANGDIAEAAPATPPGVPSSIKLPGVAAASPIPGKGVGEETDKPKNGAKSTNKRELPANPVLNPVTQYRNHTSKAIRKAERCILRVKKYEQKCGLQYCNENPELQSMFCRDTLSARGGSKGDEDIAPSICTTLEQARQCINQYFLNGYANPNRINNKSNIEACMKIPKQPGEIEDHAQKTKEEREKARTVGGKAADEAEALLEEKEAENDAKAKAQVESLGGITLMDTVSGMMSNGKTSMNNSMQAKMATAMAMTKSAHQQVIDGRALKKFQSALEGPRDLTSNGKAVRDLKKIYGKAGELNHILELYGDDNRMPLPPGIFNLLLSMIRESHLDPEKSRFSMPPSPDKLSRCVNKMIVNLDRGLAEIRNSQLKFPMVGPPIGRVLDSMKVKNNPEFIKKREQAYQELVEKAKEETQVPPKREKLPNPEQLISSRREDLWDHAEREFGLKHCTEGEECKCGPPVDPLDENPKGTMGLMWYGKLYTDNETIAQRSVSDATKGAEWSRPKIVNSTKPEKCVPGNFTNRKNNGRFKTERMITDSLAGECFCQDLTHPSVNTKSQPSTSVAVDTKTLESFRRLIGLDPEPKKIPGKTGKEKGPTPAETPAVDEDGVPITDVNGDSVDVSGNPLPPPSGSKQTLISNLEGFRDDKLRDLETNDVLKRQMKPVTDILHTYLEEEKLPVWLERWKDLLDPQECKLNTPNLGKSIWHPGDSPAFWETYGEYLEWYKGVKSL